MNGDIPIFSMLKPPLKCIEVDVSISTWRPMRLIRTNIGNIHFPDNMVRLRDTPLIYTPQISKIGRPKGGAESSAISR